MELPRRKTPANNMQLLLPVSQISGESNAGTWPREAAAATGHVSMATPPTSVRVKDGNTHCLCIRLIHMRTS